MSGTSDASSLDGMELEEEQQIAFEHRSDFVYEQLLKCAVDKSVDGPLFITRHDGYFFKWKLLVGPKEKENNTLGLYLKPIDCQQNVSAELELFCGKKKQEKYEVDAFEIKKDDDIAWGASEFLPSVESLKEKGLVVDGVVSMGVKIILSVSDFDPHQWVPMPSVTPDPGHIARKLFSNLNTGNRRRSDFTIVVGIGAGKKELYVHQVVLEEIPFFNRLFGGPNGAGGGWKENCEESMTLPTFSVGVVKEALRFLYLNEIGQNLMRFGPQLLDLANQWELSDLQKAIEREMITKLMSDRLNFSLAADYFQLADTYDQEVLRRVAMCRLIEMWPKFVDSPTGRNMKSDLKNELIACSMSSLSGVVIPSE